LISTQERFEEKFEKGNSCWNWTAYKDWKGYGRFELAGRVQYAHRVSYQLYVGEIPEGLYICHRCDNPSCVRPAHLFLGTNADNMRDRENKGRCVHPSGEKHGRAKLTEEQVKTIRTRRGDGVRSSVFEKEFGVAHQTISDIVNYRRWAKI
jgi:hypothetical protein